MNEKILSKFRAIVGGSNVLFQPVDLALYSYDAALDRAFPSAVVFPETTRQTASIVKICREHKICFVARGAGTNLCGAAVPLQGAVVIAPTRMKKIISIDPKKRIAVVEPGLPNLFLKKVLEPHGLYYAPDPASQKACTIGGNIGTNAGGPHCLKYGVTSHHVYAMEIVLPDGEILRCGLNQIGFDLTGFFVGSEGTLGIVTEASLNLLSIPSRVETMLVSFPSLETAIQAVTDIISSGIIPATLEAMDRITVQAVEAFVHAGYPTDAEAVLLIEVDGEDEIKEDVEEIKKICAKNSSMEFRIAKDEKEREKLWEGRRGSYPAMARLAPNVLVEDGAVPRNKLPEATHKIRQIAKESGINLSIIFHAGDGNLHPQILFDERNPEETEKVKRAGYAMLKVCVDLGGTISGEHGIGTDKREAMRWLFTPETLALFRRIKNEFDPGHLCNPDKLIPVVEKTPNPFEKGPAVPMAKEFVPNNEEELRNGLISLGFSDKKAVVQGLKSHSKEAVQADCVISTKLLSGIVEHDAENFTVTVRGGTSVQALSDFLQSKNQKVLILPEGTVGGMIAFNRAQTPFLRDQILGMRVMLPNGEIVQFGAKVMKNVAGYDASKLLIGSCGTLGVILSVILKCFPMNSQLNVTGAKTPWPVENLLENGPLSSTHQKIKKAFDPENRFAVPAPLKHLFS